MRAGTAPIDELVEMEIEEGERVGREPVGR